MATLSPWHRNERYKSEDRDFLPGLSASVYGPGCRPSDTSTSCFGRRVHSGNNYRFRIDGMGSRVSGRAVKTFANGVRRPQQDSRPGFCHFGRPAVSCAKVEL